MGLLSPGYAEALSAIQVITSTGKFRETFQLHSISSAQPREITRDFKALETGRDIGCCLGKSMRESQGKIIIVSRKDRQPKYIMKLFIPQWYSLICHVGISNPTQKSCN